MKSSVRALLALSLIGTAAAGANAAEVPVERDTQVTAPAGCHDCHTGGKVDPAAALKGTPLGWQHDLRRQYIVSLGEPGDAVPEFLPPGQEPKTPYIVIAPPIMPKG